MTKKVSIIGIGRLGLCLALVLERAGYDVLGMDIFPTYVDQINNKTFQSDEPRVMEFLKICKNFRATNSIEEAINFSDVLMVLVDTPSTGGDRFYDHSKLNNFSLKLIKEKFQTNTLSFVVPLFQDTFILSVVTFLETATMFH